MASAARILSSPRSEPLAAGEPRSSLTTPTLDFWLLGGISVVVWLAMSLADGFRAHSWAIAHHYNNLLAISASLSLICNYPHFMASYKLAYGRGPRFVLRHAFQLLLVPSALVALIFCGHRLYFEDPGAARALLLKVNLGLTSIGLDTAIGRAPTLGKELMGLAICFMHFTVGWHYSKQVFGCMMVYGRFDGYGLSASQRRLIKASLFSIWASNFTYFNLSPGSG